MNKIIYNKSAEVGTTITWVIATVIIIVLMILFLSISGVIGPKGGLLSLNKIVTTPETQESLFGILNTEVKGRKIIEIWRDTDYYSNPGIIGDLEVATDLIMDGMAKNGRLCFSRMNDVRESNFLVLEIFDANKYTPLKAFEDQSATRLWIPNRRGNPKSTILQCD